MKTCFAVNVCYHILINMFRDKLDKNKRRSTCEFLEKGF